MKTFLIFFLLPAAFCPGRVLPVHQPRNAADHNGVLLVYTGKMGSRDIGVHVEIDSSVGVRYEVVIESGSKVLSHTAVFYKFSDPQKTVFYNFLTHQSMPHYCCGSSSGGGPNVKAVGTDVVNNYKCTHVQGVNNNERDAQDYWVSTQVPGYLLLLKILGNIGSGAAQMFIDGNIFQWGGLVRMTVASGAQVIGTLNLSEANPGMSFPATDFDVPSK